MIPHFLYTEVNCDNNCHVVYGVIMYLPDEVRVVESLVRALETACSQAREDHKTEWRRWRTYSDKPYEDFLRQYPAPDLQRIINLTCHEFGLDYYPNTGGSQI